MPEEWEFLRRKSAANIRLADKLLKDKDSADLGFAMFHAQQGVELAVKSCIYKFGLYRYIIEKDLRNKLFYWEDVDSSVKPILFSYLKKLDQLSWINDDATMVKKRDLININKGDEYVNLIPRRNTGTVDIIFQGRRIHELFLEKRERKTLVLSRDITFRTHDPLVVLLEEALAFTQSRLSGGIVLNREITGIASRFVKTLTTLVEIMKKMEKDEELLHAMWKKSLNIDTSHTEVVKLLKELEAIEKEGLVNEVSISCANIIRKLVFDLFQDIRKAHRSLAIKYSIIPQVREILSEHNIPPSLVDSFVDINQEKYRQEISGFVEKVGGIRILNIIFRPNGILQSMQDIKIDMKNIEFKKMTNSLSEFAKRYSWLSHVVSISVIIILMFPHVSIGRYPVVVGGIDSETLYSKHLADVQTRFKECETACGHLQDLLA